MTVDDGQLEQAPVNFNTNFPVYSLKDTNLTSPPSSCIFGRILDPKTSLINWIVSESFGSI